MASFMQALHDPSNGPWLMGILNVTADSFSDGGDFMDTDKALLQAQNMVADGAKIIDIGAESTRPGAQPVSDAVQIARVIPVIRKLHEEFADQVYLSIDARRTAVARAAIEAGATIINDVEAGNDEGMLDLAAQTRAPIVLMHMQGKPQTMQDNPHYDDVVGEVKSFLLSRVEQALSAGVAAEQIIIDPGIGFGKTREHNLQLVRHLKDFVDTGYPVLLGTSRKRFMGSICRETVFKDLVGATCATTVLGVQAGIRIFRVHDVRENRQALEVTMAVNPL
ncbi:MAG: dihydropteroate synthase [Gammaproteobacteria bacterium]